MKSNMDEESGGAVPGMRCRDFTTGKLMMYNWRGQLDNPFEITNSGNLNW